MLHIVLAFFVLNAVRSNKYGAFLVTLKSVVKICVCLRPLSKIVKKKVQKRQNKITYFLNHFKMVDFIGFSYKFSRSWCALWPLFDDYRLLVPYSKRSLSWVKSSSHSMRGQQSGYICVRSPGISRQFLPIASSDAQLFLWKKRKKYKNKCISMVCN